MRTKFLPTLLMNYQINKTLIMDNNFKRFKKETDAVLTRDYHSSLDDLGVFESEVRDALLNMTVASFVGFLKCKYHLHKKTVTPPARGSLLTFKYL